MSAAESGMDFVTARAPRISLSLPVVLRWQDWQRANMCRCMLALAPHPHEPACRATSARTAQDSACSRVATWAAATSRIRCHSRVIRDWGRCAGLNGFDFVAEPAERIAQVVRGRRAHRQTQGQPERVEARGLGLGKWAREQRTQNGARREQGDNEPAVGRGEIIRSRGHAREAERRYCMPLFFRNPTRA